MADIFTKEKRSRVMSNIRADNTKPELSAEDIWQAKAKDTLNTFYLANKNRNCYDIRDIIYTKNLTPEELKDFYFIFGDEESETDLIDFSENFQDNTPEYFCRLYGTSGYGYEFLDWELSEESYTSNTAIFKVTETIDVETNKYNFTLEFILDEESDTAKLEYYYPNSNKSKFSGFGKISQK